MSEHSADIGSRRAPELLLPPPRRDARGLAVSLTLHAALALLFIGGIVGSADRLLVAGGGTDGPLGGGGSGGGRVSYIELPPMAARQEAVKAAEPVQVVEPVKTEEPEAIAAAEPIQPIQSSGVQGAATVTGGAGGVPGAGGSGGGSGGGQGGGVGVVTGPGTGGDSTDIAPPQLRNWVPPMERPPKELRGRTIRVTFWVTVDGRVEKFETDPEIRDRDYLEKFSEIVMKTRFRPARTRAGVPVAVVFPMDFILSTGS